MNFRFEAHTRHANGLAYPLLFVDDELLRQNVENLLVCRNSYRTRRINYTFDIIRCHFAIADSNNAM